MKKDASRIATTLRWIEDPELSARLKEFIKFLTSFFLCALVELSEADFYFGGKSIPR